MEINSENLNQLSIFFWSLINGNPEILSNLKFDGAQSVLPSKFDVTAFASTSIGIASLAVAEFKTIRLQSSSDKKFPKINVNTIEACASFKGDSLFTPIGWELPSPWDPFAGDYQCSDGWIRLHTNYSYHRDAVFKVLGRFSNREELAQEVSKKKSAELEQCIFEAGGCSAVMYSRSNWEKHIHGIHTLDEKIIQQIKLHENEANFDKIYDGDLPLKGIRILDMTRVIAGPTCTKFLSAYGAEVLRIDPPNFAEVEALLPETTVGKRRAFLDVKSIEGRRIFEKLLKESHVFVHGLRPDSLEKLGIDLNFLSKINPSLIVASINAYGSTGPWKKKRGFDSLVQMSSGIAEAAAQFKKSLKPIPLPVQALDHATGYLMAAGVCRSLSELYRDNRVNGITGSLIGASNILQKFSGNFEIESPANSLFSSTLVEEKTDWGLGLRVRCPGTINGQYTNWKIAAGPLGKDTLSF
jgi:hypothetical protein